MPRKKIIKEPITHNRTVDSLLLVKHYDENVVLQLHLSDLFINNIINNENTNNEFEPKAYEPSDVFINEAEKILTDCPPYKRSACFWCCHDITNFSCGMPINYNHTKGYFCVYGTFCSFQCASAYNFSINCKSDKVWYVNSLINMLACRYGYKEKIRPAPSRYLLELFGGPMNIEDFRKVHTDFEKSHIINIPPMITINSTNEILNTSYVSKKSNKSIADKKISITS